jgi:1-phosphatidylinositol phosphodiesterase
LTRQTLVLKHVEHFEALAQKRSTSEKVDRLASNFTSLLKDVKPGNSKDSSSARKKLLYTRLDVNAKPMKDNAVSITLEPFKAHETSIPTGGATGTNTKVLRLTFADENGVKYRIDIPAPGGESQTLKILTPGRGSQQYTSIYNSNSAVLALFDTSNLSKWMKAMPEHLSLSALSIPGTHNSPTCHSALPSVRCQAVSPAMQLDNGVRFFDIRVQVDDPEKAGSDALQLVHSVFPISLKGSKPFRGLLDDIYTFLQKNPSETVILCLKREGRGNGTDVQLADRLKDHYVDPKQWHTESGIPQLGDARGKIVLMRRFGLSDRLKTEFHGKGWGIDATNWGDNTPNHHGGDVRIQDFYEVTDTENIDKKIQLVCEHFERAGSASITTAATGNNQKRNTSPLFINFLSASNFWKPGCWPEKIAEKLNPAITTFLCEKHDVQDESKGDGCTGIVVCDWVGEDGDWDLVRAIVGMNSRILMKEDRRLDKEGESGNQTEETFEGGGHGRGRGRGAMRGGMGRGRGGNRGVSD